MADAQYGMGQYRYSGGSGTCMEKLSSTVKSLDWQIETDTSPWYRDIVVQLSNGNFESDQPYYLEFGIPQDLNYNLAFAVDFIQYTNNVNFRYEEGTTVYQFLRYIEVTRKLSEGITNSLVCLYKIRNKNGTVADANPRTAISNKAFVEENQSYTNDDSVKAPTASSGVFFEINNPPVGYIYYPNVLYHDRVSDTYWMFAGTDTKTVVRGYNPYGEDNILEGTNDVMLSWIWEVEQQTNMAYFKMIVTPRKSFFNAIVLKMARIQEDRDIVTDEHVNNSGTQVSNGKSIYGRWVDLNQATGNLKEDGTTEYVKDTFKIYKLKNLNQASILNSSGRALKRIGIWGHPELLMAIEGEEIKIGSSGYYELDDYNFKNICIAAEGTKDVFVLDYQYEL